MEQNTPHCSAISGNFLTALKKRTSFFHNPNEALFQDEGLKMSKRIQTTFRVFIIFSVMMFSLKPSITNRIYSGFSHNGTKRAAFNLSPSLDSGNSINQYRGSFENPTKRVLTQPILHVPAVEPCCSALQCQTSPSFCLASNSCPSCRTLTVLRI